MKKLLIIFVLIPIIALADDFKIKITSGHHIIASRPSQKIELGQKFYVISDSLVTGEAFITKIFDQYCILELKEGKAYAGDKLIQLNQLQKAKYEIAKEKLKKHKKIAKQQTKIFTWMLSITIIIAIIYSQIK